MVITIADNVSLIHTYIHISPRVLLGMTVNVYQVKYNCTILSNLKVLAMYILYLIAIAGAK